MYFQSCWIAAFDSELKIPQFHCIKLQNSQFKKVATYVKRHVKLPKLSNGSKPKKRIRISKIDTITDTENELRKTP